MGKTSKSPKDVLLTAHRVGQRCLRVYSHLFSPKKFTQPQLFACLVLKEFLRLDYRKLSALLTDTPTLAGAIELETIPHFTTFQKAYDRLLGSRRAKRLLDETVDGAMKHKLMKRRVKLAAIDGTGFESRHVSTYYAKRKQQTAGNKGRKRRRFPKAGIVCDCESHVILAVVPGRGPMPDDKHFKPGLKQAVGTAKIDTLLADAPLRWRTIACTCSRGAWHEDGDSSQAGSPDQQVAQREMEETHGNPLQQEKVRPAVASRNRQQHDQTVARIIASCKKGSNAEP